MGIREVWSSSLVDRFNEEPMPPYEGPDAVAVSGEVDRRLELEEYYQRKTWDRMQRGVR